MSGPSECPIPGALRISQATYLDTNLAFEVLRPEHGHGKYGGAAGGCKRRKKRKAAALAREHASQRRSNDTEHKC